MQRTLTPNTVSFVSVFRSLSSTFNGKCVFAFVSYSHFTRQQQAAEKHQECVFQFQQHKIFVGCVFIRIIRLFFIRRWFQLRLSRLHSLRYDYLQVSKVYAYNAQTVPIGTDDQHLFESIYLTHFSFDFRFSIWEPFEWSNFIEAKTQKKKFIDFFANFQFETPNKVLFVPERAYCSSVISFCVFFCYFGIRLSRSLCTRRSLLWYVDELLRLIQAANNDNRSVNSIAIHD